MHFERACAGKGGLPRPEMQNKHNISMKVTLGRSSTCAHSPDSDLMQEITHNFEQKGLIRWGRQNHCAAVQRSMLSLVGRPRPGLIWWGRGGRLSHQQCQEHTNSLFSEGGGWARATSVQRHQQ